MCYYPVSGFFFSFSFLHLCAVHVMGQAPSPAEPLNQPHLVFETSHPWNPWCLTRKIPRAQPVLWLGVAQHGFSVDVRDGNGSPCASISFMCMRCTCICHSGCVPFPPSTLWIPGVKLKSLEFTANTFYTLSCLTSPFGLCGSGSHETQAILKPTMHLRVTLNL